MRYARREWLPKAIAYFKAQTYPNKELLVISDGADVRDLVPPDVRLIHIDEGYSIGEKRNFGCEKAKGEIIAHWDDDDYSAPDRLSDQVDHLLRSEKSVAAYSSMYFTDGKAWWQYRGNANVAIGSSLCYRKDWWRGHPFAARQVGEDGEFSRAAFRAGQMITAPANLLMAASIHPGNTSPRQLCGHPWHKERDFAGVPGLNA